MIINRHNYEEYFILYMDNELGNDVRRQVEAFVQKNPDLKEELDILLQYKLVPDMDIVYAGKEELMIPIATGNSPVNFTNYEEWLVLYIDNELTIKQKIVVEQFISSHPPASKELTLLQRTKLQPEAIIFTHKESLYMREVDPDRYRDRPLPFRWFRLRQAFGDRRWRVVAAAILIITVGLTAVMVLNKRSPGKTDMAKDSSNEQKINETAPVLRIKEKNTTFTSPVIADSRKQDLPVASKQTGNSKAAKNNARKETAANTIQIPFKKEEQVVVDNKPSNNLPKPMNNSTLKNNTPWNDVSNINTPKELISPNPLTKKIVTTDLPIPSYAKSTDDDVDLSQSEKKGKLRGFFRKVTRTFEKRTNIDATDDDKLLVGGLAFKLK